MLTIDHDCNASLSLCGRCIAYQPSEDLRVLEKYQKVPEDRSAKAVFLAIIFMGCFRKFLSSVKRQFIAKAPNNSAAFCLVRSTKTKKNKLILNLKKLI
jgi:hypothetical protein